jgi:hypothetical protein
MVRVFRPAAASLIAQRPQIPFTVSMPVTGQTIAPAYQTTLSMRQLHRFETYENPALHAPLGEGLFIRSNHH